LHSLCKRGTGITQFSEKPHPDYSNSRQKKIEGEKIKKRKRIVGPRKKNDFTTLRKETETGLEIGNPDDYNVVFPGRTFAPKDYRFFTSIRRKIHGRYT